MLNHIVIMGRLTRDPELRYTKTDRPVANFTVAVDRDNSKNADQPTDFLDVVAWKKTAEFADKYLKKGSLVTVSGRMTVRNWQDKEGRKRIAPEIVADNVYFAETRKAENPSAGVDVPPPSLEELGDDEGGELPF